MYQNDHLSSEPYAGHHIRKIENECTGGYHIFKVTSSIIGHDFSRMLKGFDNRENRYWYDKEWFSSGNVSFRFDENEEFSMLTLKPVKQSHEGQYRCRVDFKRAPTRHYIVNLTVIVPPKKLNIIDDKGVEMSNSMSNVIGPYYEGSTISISCIAYGGSPIPTVTWWKENALLDHHSEQLTDESVKNVFVIEKLTRNHMNSVFTCQATNNNFTIPLMTTVTVSMILSPLWVKLQGVNKAMSAGRPYEISCQVFGAYPSPVITWWLGTVKVKIYEKSDSNDGNSTISRLNFIPEAEDDGKVLLCRAESPVPSSVPLQDSWKLNITYKPVASIELGKNLDASAIKEGVDVYFECKIKSNLPVYKVMWKQDGKLLRSNQSSGILVTNQELVLQKVSRFSSGLYSCVATNMEGDGESSSTYLNVKYAPVCYNSHAEEHGVGRGESVRVTCEVIANPADDMRFVWRFNNTSSSEELPLKQNSNGTRSFAEFEPKSEFDYGTLSCWARNALGETKEPCIFKIFPAGKPDPVTNCTVINKTLESFHIRCSSGFDGGSKQSFVMEVREDTTNTLLKNMSNDVPEFVVSGLRPGFVFNIILYASNSKGRSQIVALTETLERLHSDFDCSVEMVNNVSDEKKANLTQETDISLILQNSYGTDNLILMPHLVQRSSPVVNDFAS
ncbi:hypothetical protein V9T40_007702 [Parthenolecanium corni]|uniref:Nephrin/kirre n=1 Tax=Parthenolecanium corni TaxID=536013 RepID=A0AAN9THJ7_9HEMI